MQTNTPEWIRTNGAPYGQYIAHAEDDGGYVVVAWSDLRGHSVGRVSPSLAINLQQNGTRHEPQRVPASEIA